MFASLLTAGLERFAEVSMAVLDQSRPAENRSGSGRLDDDARSAVAGHTPAGPGDGAPVLLIGGLGTTAPFLRPLTRWLGQRGYAVTPVTVGAGLDCAEQTVDELSGVLEDLADRSRRRVRLVGHSRGGQFARVLARRRPDLAGALVTVGTPFDLYALRWPTFLTAAAITLAGTLGIGGLARVTCLAGGCCRRFRADLRAPVPDGVPFTSVYSREDRVVPYEACRACATHDSAAHRTRVRNVEVPGSHVGLLVGPHARSAVVDGLAAAHDDGPGGRPGADVTALPAPA